MSETKRRRKKVRKKRTPKARSTDEAPKLSPTARRAAWEAREVQRHQRMALLGGGIAIIGGVIIGTRTADQALITTFGDTPIHEAELGGIIVLVGLLIMIAMIHRFGRLGAEQPASVAPRTRAPAD